MGGLGLTWMSVLKSIRETIEFCQLVAKTILLAENNLQEYRIISAKSSNMKLWLLLNARSSICTTGC